MYAWKLAQLAALIVALTVYIVAVAQSRNPRQAYIGASFGMLAFWSGVMALILD